MSDAALEQRLLILAPFGKDAALLEKALRNEGVACAVCPDIEALAGELERGAAALIVAEEALGRVERLARAVSAQPPWSDLPILLLARPGADSAAVARSLQTLGNVTLLERPVRAAALASGVRSALRARERQYQTRAHLQEREHADRRKDEFLAMLAHELRNPLAPIRNAVHLMRLAGPQGGEAPMWEMLERQIGHLVRLVDDLLEVSRFTRGKIELRRGPVDLAAVIGAAVETSSPLIESARHHLSVALPGEALVVDADATRLAQVFSNLLNNAARYTDPGGEISLRGWREDGFALISVADNGIGISAETLPGVFELFTQGDARGGRGQTGLGIGLTLARNLVELHGGSIAAASEGPGRGASFTVRLPLSRAAVQTSEPLAEPASQRAGAPRVLVADDNRDAADTLGALLRMLGAEVEVVHDGQAAIEAFSTFRPAAMFLDLGMPGLDGYEVARRLRSRAEASGTTLVALTGWGQEKDRQMSRAAGFRHHLVKPVDLAAMQAVLASVAR